MWTRQTDAIQFLVIMKNKNWTICRVIFMATDAAPNRVFYEILLCMVSECLDRCLAAATDEVSSTGLTVHSEFCKLLINNKLYLRPLLQEKLLFCNAVQQTSIFFLHLNSPMQCTYSINGFDTQFQ
jgi:hypothetical protein